MKHIQPVFLNDKKETDWNTKNMQLGIALDDIRRSFPDSNVQVSYKTIPAPGSKVTFEMVITGTNETVLQMVKDARDNYFTPIPFDELPPQRH